MTTDPSLLATIHEINRLWEPVFPHLALHIASVYGRRDGHVVEIGPFIGVIRHLRAQGVGASFAVAAFPGGAAGTVREDMARAGLAEAIPVRETDPLLSALPDDTVDLLVFRGALFFPGLFPLHLQALYRVLTPGSVAFVGGGFGRDTPSGVIQPIAQKSKDLNLKIGKVEVTRDTLDRMVTAEGLGPVSRIEEEGGLWIVMRKQPKE